MDFKNKTVEEIEDILDDCEHAEISIDDLYGDTSAGTNLARELIRRLRER